MSATADGKQIYVTNEGGNDVTVVDPASGKTSTIAVGNAPRKVVVLPVATAGAAAPGTKVSIVNFTFAPAEVAVATEGGTSNVQ